MYCIYRPVYLLDPGEHPLEHEADLQHGDVLHHLPQPHALNTQLSGQHLVYKVDLSEQCKESYIPVCILP